MLKPEIEMNTIEGVLSTVRQTGMVTLMPDAAVRWDNYPDLVVKKLSDKPGDLSCRKAGLLWATGEHRTAAARVFAGEVHAIIQRDSARLAGTGGNGEKGSR